MNDIGLLDWRKLPHTFRFFTITRDDDRYFARGKTTAGRWAEATITAAAYDWNAFLSSRLFTAHFKY